MRAILLAAGMATRLKPLTDSLPKCLLEVGGKSIVSRAVGIMADHGLRRFTLVDGYFGDLLREKLTSEFPAGWFEFVRNEVYSTTNNAYSLFLARYDCQEPMLLSDADILYEPGVVTRLLEDPRPNRLALRTQGGLGEEEMKVAVDGAGCVSDIAKPIPVEAAVGESVGLEVFSAAFAKRLFETLERRMLVEGRTDEYYEASFVELIRAGEQLHPVDLGALRCMEVDTLDDLEHARRIFA